MSEPPVHTSGDEVHAHAHKTGHGWIDMVIAVSAITISVISLFVAVAHGRTEEKLVAANSWPFLVFKSSQNGLVAGSRTVVLGLQNSGVGPARVQSVEIMLDGRPVHTFDELMSRCCGLSPKPPLEQLALGLQTRNDVVGVLPAREGVSFLAWREGGRDPDVWNRLNAARHRLTFKACYCSVLDECWTSDLTPTAKPRPVAQCEASPDGYAD